MSLSRVIYFSKVNPVNPLDLRHLLATCKKNNEPNGVTGFLYFSGEFFIQVLEGERAAVSDLYHRIVVDNRHRGIVLIHFAEISERAFPLWFMGLREGADDWTDELFTKCFGSKAFDPTTADADATLEVMQHLALDVLDQMT